MTELNNTTVVPNAEPLTPEEVIAQLRALRSQIEDVAPLSQEQRKLNRSPASPTADDLPLQVPHTKDVSRLPANDREMTRRPSTGPHAGPTFRRVDEAFFPSGHCFVETPAL